MTSPTTPLLFPTAEWLDRFKTELRGSEEFRAATRTWNDDSLFVFNADPAAGWDRAAGFYMKWQGGQLTTADLVDEPHARQAVFCVEALYSDWAHVYRKRMEAGIAFLTGRFKFRGPFAKAAMNIIGEVLMLKIAYTIPTRFVDEVGAPSAGASR